MHQPISNPSSCARVADEVRDALAAAGHSPVMVGYDLIGIQEIVGASTRPRGMMGSSGLIKTFDQHAPWFRGGGGPGRIFAGGGQGLCVVPASRTDEVIRGLRTALGERIDGARLAVAAVRIPADDGGQARALRWLRTRLRVGKDSAPAVGPPQMRIGPAGICADCRRRPACKTWKSGDDRRPVCRRCQVALEWAGEEARTSLADLSNDNRLALVFADGNNLGDFFAGLHDLTAAAIASHAVVELFQHAHAASLQRAGLRPEQALSPVTGGDDIRAFLPPTGVERYVSALAGELHTRADACGVLEPWLGAEKTERLRQVGVGIGVVVASDHYPASRLFAYAQQAEDRAKEICRDGGARSAVHVELLTSGDELIQDRRGRAAEPMELERAWPAMVHRAHRLARVPGSQRAQLAAMLQAGASDSEVSNLLRYQVARSKPWRDFVNACLAASGGDWTHGHRLQIPEPIPLGALLRLLPILDTREKKP